MPCFNPWLYLSSPPSLFIHNLCLFLTVIRPLSMSVSFDSSGKDFTHCGFTPVSSLTLWLLCLCQTPEVTPTLMSRSSGGGVVTLNLLVHRGGRGQGSASSLDIDIDIDKTACRWIEFFKHYLHSLGQNMAYNFWSDFWSGRFNSGDFGLSELTDLQEIVQYMMGTDFFFFFFWLQTIPTCRRDCCNC